MRDVTEEARDFCASFNFRCVRQEGRTLWIKREDYDRLSKSFEPRIVVDDPKLKEFVHHLLQFDLLPETDNA